MKIEELKQCACCKRWKIILATDWPYCLDCYKERKRKSK